MAVRTAEVIYVGDAASLLKAQRDVAAGQEASTSRIEAAGKRAEAAVVKQQKATEKSAKDGTAAVSKIGRDSAIAIAAVAGASVDVGIKLEKATAQIAAAGGTTVAAASKITDAFSHMAVGANSAHVVAEAYSTVAGELRNVEGHALNAAEALKVMNAAERLQLATGESLKNSTEALGKVMLTYGISARGAGAASDILYNASKATGVQIGTIAQTVDRIRGRLGSLAPSLRETTGLMDDLTKHGISGRLVMSALSGTFNTLVGNAKAVAAKAKQLGLEIYNSQGKFVGLTSIIAQLQPKLEKLTEASQIQTTKTLFGATANKQLLSIILQGPAAFNAATAAMSKHGTAAAAAKLQSETLEGEWKKEKAAAENLGGALGKVLVPELKDATSAITDSIEWLKKHETAAIALGGAITSVLGAAMVVFASQKVKAFNAGLQDMGAALKALVTRSSETAAAVEGANAAMAESSETTAATMDGALMTTGIGVTLVALGTAAALLATHWKESMAAMEEVGITTAKGIIKALDGVIDVYNDTLGKLTGDISKIKELETAGERAVNAPIKNFGTPTSKGLGGGSAASQIGTALTSSGLSSTVAAGVVKLLYAESGLKTTATGSEGAYGIAQWLGTRRMGLEAYAGTHHSSGNSLQTQIGYLLSELRGPQKGTLQALKGAHSTREAEEIFMKKFEIPAESQYSKIMGRAEDYHLGSSATKHATKHAATTGTGTIKDSEELAKEESEKKSAVKKAATTAKKAAKEEEAARLAAVRQAEKLVGHFAETGHDSGPELDALQKEFHTRAAAWCAEFATTAAMMGGANKAVRTASVATIREWAEQGSHGYKKGVSRTPLPGSLMLFGDSHTGFVQSVNRGAGTVTTIEGNTKVGDGAVRRVTHKISEGEYANPIYSKAATGAGSLKELATGYSTAAKEALAKQTADKKQGESQLSKILAAIASGSASKLTEVVGSTHDKWLAKLESKLDADHTSKLTDLSNKLVAAHKKALSALSQALIATSLRQRAEATSAVKAQASELVKQAGEAWEAIQKGMIEAAHTAAIKALENGPLAGAIKGKKEQDEAEQTRQTEESNSEALETATKHLKEAKGNENPEEIKEAEKELRHAEEAITAFKRQQDEKRSETQLEQETKAIDASYEAEINSLDERRANYEATVAWQIHVQEEQLAKMTINWAEYQDNVNRILASSGTSITPGSDAEKHVEEAQHGIVPYETGGHEQGFVTVGKPLKPNPAAGHASGGFVYPRRASGGGVYMTPYWVGEAGPELFTPGSPGMITPASRSGAVAGATGASGGVVINMPNATIGSRRDADRLAFQLAMKLTHGGRR